MGPSRCKFAPLRYNPTEHMDGHFFVFFHSLLRYGVLVAVAYAGLAHLAGLLLQRPILTVHRTMAIVAMVLCHLQLVTGLILYLMHGWYAADSSQPLGRFWKFEHIGMMVIAITLVTLGRSLSKRAKIERSKQLRVAVFFLIGLLIMLWAIPWPFTEIGRSSGKGWL